MSFATSFLRQGTRLGLHVPVRNMAAARSYASSSGASGESIAADFIRQGKKIVAIGRNYSDHIKELNNTAPVEPFFFLKPTSSYVFSGGKVEIPKGIIAHHEVELGVVIGKSGRDIPQKDAFDYVAGYTLAVDMTARNLQDEVKKRGLPWSAAKGFDTFTPIAPFIPKTSVPDPSSLRLTLQIDGETKQNGTTDQMINPIPRLIEHISSIMALEDGDLILTGTPAGVGPLRAGQNVICTLAIDGSEEPLATLAFGVVDREGGYQFKPQ